MRFIGLDVHRDFCEVALVQDGALRSVGQILTAPAELEIFAQSLGPDDVVAMEATANALAIARVIEPHVQRVVLADPKAVKGMTGLRAKTDKIDARLLARLLAAGFLAEVWTPDEQTRVRRRLISRRVQLVRQRVREKNQVHAVLQRQLKRRPPMTDVFGVKGRVWLSDQCRLLPVDEHQTVDACLRQIDFLEREIELVDVEIAKQVLSSQDIRRLMTLPGVSGVTATAMMAAIGDVERLPTADHLVGYLGLSPRVHQSGSEPAKHGRISKQGPGPVRGLLVEAAWHAARTTGPLRAFHQRIAARRGANIATVAVARKLGEPARAFNPVSRYLQPEGYGDELRAACVAGSDSCGNVTLVREGRTARFDPEEGALMARLSSPIGRGLRRSLTVSPDSAQPEAGDHPPGVLVLDRNHRAVAMTAEAEVYLDELDDGSGLPQPVFEALLALRHDGATRFPAHRVRTRQGRWLTVHAAPPEPGSSAWSEVGARGDAAPRMFRTWRRAIGPECSLASGGCAPTLPTLSRGPLQVIEASKLAGFAELSAQLPRAVVAERLRTCCPRPDRATAECLAPSVDRAGDERSR